MTPPPRDAIHSQRMELVGRLSSSVVHDLNNLLTVIQLHAALLEGGEDFAGADVPDAARQIGQACKHASQLTRKVLDLARQRSEEDRPLVIDDLCHDLGRLFEAFVAKKARVTVEMHDAPLWVRGNSGELEQMLMNLVLNAIDAMPGGGLVRVVCRRAAEGERAFVEIVIEDEGGGIPAEFREQVLERSFTTREGSGGHGMGLCIVNEIVKRHAGDITFANAPVRGTVVRVRLPALDDYAVPDFATEAETPPGERHTILIVEDDPGIRHLTRYILENAGYEVLPADSGEAAMEIWNAHRPTISLLFTDLVLPGEMSGRDVVLAVLADEPDLPVLYTSGYAAAWEEHAFFNEANFVAKPFAPDALLRRIAGVLRRR